MRRHAACSLLVGAVFFLTLSLTSQSAVLPAQQEPVVISQSSVFEPPATATAAVSGAVPTGYSQFNDQTGLTDPRSFGYAIGGTGSNFSSCKYVVEGSAGRVSSACGGNTTTSLATGLSSPTDIVFPPALNTPYGNFLFVTESGANRIVTVSSTGTVTPFATFPVAPRRMAFSPPGTFVPSAFAPNLLWVTLADGSLVTVSSTGGVTPCVTGLNGPEGLVFGAGGPGFKNALYVAESGGNRISKVLPDCTSSVFASGLSGPVGLEISPGGPWGPVDSLYVTNSGGTRIERVAGNGAITSFATALANVETIRFRFSSTAPTGSRLNGPNLMFAEKAAGNVIGAFTIFPSISWPNFSCSPCSPGGTLSFGVSITNGSPIDLPVEIKAGFRTPDGNPVPLAPLLNSDRHFETTLPKGFNFSQSWLTLTLPPVPPGVYCYEIALLESDGAVSPYTQSRICFSIMP